MSRRRGAAVVRSGEEENDGAPPAATAMARRWSNSRSPPGWRRPTASPASATRDRFGWRGADAPPTATKAPPPTRGGPARTPPTKKTPGGPVPIRPNARVDTTDRRCGRSWRALRRRRPAMVITRTISLFSGRRPAAMKNPEANDFGDRPYALFDRDALGASVRMSLLTTELVESLELSTTTTLS